MAAVVSGAPLGEEINATGGRPSSPLTTEDVLRQEAEAIHGADLSGKTGNELYRRLNDLGSAALCLSGGGIRSAAFALGIIQSLASHPRPSRNTHVAAAEDSLLSRFQYLSTVSGGGYIGSWLSAWVTRAGFPYVWANLVARPAGPDEEPQALAWLRGYSNYLTPRLGLFSPDAWTDVVLYVRNLLLNWLVTIPVLCLVILLLKLVALFVAWVGKFPPLWSDTWWVWIAPALGAVSLLMALRFTISHRPTRQRPALTPAATPAAGSGAEVDRSEIAEKAFLRGDLLPGVLAAFFLMLAVALPCTHDYVVWKLSSCVADASSGACLGQVTVIGALAAMPIYFLSWVLARPRFRNLKNIGRARRDYWGDLVAWTISGAIYGALLGVGVYFYVLRYGEGVWIFKSFDILLLVFGVPWAIMSQLLAEMIFVGLTSRQENSDPDREWLARAAGFYVVVAAGWFLVMLLVFVGSDLAQSLYGQLQKWIAPIGGVAGLITVLAGKSPASRAADTAKDPKKKSWLSFSVDTMLAIAAPIFAAVLVILASALLDTVLLGKPLTETNFWLAPAGNNQLVGWPGEACWLILGLIIAAIIGFFASYYVNINRFSLHALYRNRLVRAFLGASNEKRDENPFIKFDDLDNPRMHTLWPSPNLTSGIRPLARGVDWRPFHVVNIALNIVSSKRLAWQQRKAEPFTVSPLHSGTACKKYRLTQEYGHPDKGISLGTALAISGAAASPNMGYHSSPGVTFLLAMFNVRLGWWLGNPGEEGNRTYTEEGPDFAIRSFLNEMLGLTTDDQPYVYLSDGGHFENLGLYEMVRRRCKFIVVSDAGCDSDFAFEDLGNAVRKIALDLGVSISFHGLSTLRTRASEDNLERQIAARERGGWRITGRDLDFRATASSNDNGQPPSPGEDGWRISGRKLEFTAGRDSEDEPLHAIGTIDYGGGQQGVILYVKAAYHKDLVRNAGVRSYAIANPEFPHESTADQWFSESQFESYRALGMELMDDILERGTALLSNPSKPILDDVFTALGKKAMNDPRP